MLNTNKKKKIKDDCLLMNLSQAFKIHLSNATYSKIFLPVRIVEKFDVIIVFADMVDKII